MSVALNQGFICLPFWLLRTFNQLISYYSLLFKRLCFLNFDYSDFLAAFLTIAYLLTEFFPFQSRSCHSSLLSPGPFLGHLLFFLSCLSCTVSELSNRKMTYPLKQIKILKFSLTFSFCSFFLCMSWIQWTLGLTKLYKWIIFIIT